MKPTLNEDLQETKPDPFKIIPLKDYPLETISADPQYTEEYGYCTNEGDIPSTSIKEMEKEYLDLDSEELGDNLVVEENLEEPVLSSSSTKTKSSEDSKLNDKISPINYIDPNLSQPLQEEGINIFMS